MHNLTARGNEDTHTHNAPDDRKPPPGAPDRDVRGRGNQRAPPSPPPAAPGGGGVGGGTMDHVPHAMRSSFMLGVG